MWKFDYLLGSPNLTETYVIILHGAISGSSKEHSLDKMAVALVSVRFVWSFGEDILIARDEIFSSWEPNRVFDNIGQHI